MNNLAHLAQQSRTSNFDISTLWDYQPPRFSCEKCRGLYVLPMEFQKTEIGGSLCPVCGVQYVPTEDSTIYPLVYLRKLGEAFDSSDLAHAQSLARVAARLRENHPFTPPLRCLFVALAQAKHFVHFTTYGISHQMIGALKMTAQRVPVRGVVSNVEGNTLSELTSHESEAPKMDIKVYGSENWADMPHQKLVVIDGLLAFKGSANLTLNGWRSALHGRDFVEAVTNIGETIDLHNRYFSPVWAELSSIGDSIIMESQIPF